MRAYLFADLLLFPFSFGGLGVAEAATVKRPARHRRAAKDPIGVAS